MVAKILNEVSVILSRELSGIERLKVRSATNRGMVNPFDIAALLKA